MLQANRQWELESCLPGATGTRGTPLKLRAWEGLLNSQDPKGLSGHGAIQGPKGVCHTDKKTGVRVPKGTSLHPIHSAMME